MWLSEWKPTVINRSSSSGKDWEHAHIHTHTYSVSVILPLTRFNLPVLPRSLVKTFNPPFNMTLIIDSVWGLINQRAHRRVKSGQHTHAHAHAHSVEQHIHEKGQRSGKCQQRILLVELCLWLSRLKPLSSFHLSSPCLKAPSFPSLADLDNEL